MIKRIISRITMRRKERRFTDMVSGKSVYVYTDCYGKDWFAEYFFLTSMRIEKC